MRMHWNIIVVLWVELISLERHDAMECVYRDDVSRDHMQENRFGNAIRNYASVLDSLNVFDCHCVTKTKVTQMLQN